MKEIMLKNNTTGLRVYINDVPNIKLVPKEEADMVIAALEQQISIFHDKKHKKQIKTLNR